MGDSMVLMLLEDLITYEHCGPLLTLTFLGAPVHLFPTKFPWIPFMHAPAADSPAQIFLPGAIT